MASSEPPPPPTPAPLNAEVSAGAAEREVVRAVFALRAPDGDVEVVRLVDPLAALPVLAAAVARDAKLADRGPAWGRAQLGGLRQVPGDRDDVDVRCGQIDQLLLIR